MGRTGRREQILEVAERLFSTRGYHATTIRDIAEETGMLSGSLYAHISSKEDLLFDIVNRGADEFLAIVTPLAEGPGSAAEKLRQAMAAHIRAVTRSVSRATVFLHEWRALEAERRAQIQAKRDAYEALFDRIIAEGVASGELRPVQPKFARLLVLSAANWVYQWYRPGGPLSADEIADTLAGMLLAGLLASDREAT